MSATFNSPNGTPPRGSAVGGTAKRVLSSLVQATGMACGSLKDTVQEKVENGDLRWVEEGIDDIKIRLEKPREKILGMAGKACGIQGGAASPDDAVAAHRAMEGGSFLDDHTLEDGTVATAEGGRSATTRDDDETTTMASTLDSQHTPPKQKSRFASVVDERRKQERAIKDAAAARAAAGGSNVVIGLCLSRRNATLGHPDTVTRQTAFDFNELQDRDYKYVSSTDESGWLAGGGERGDPYLSGVPSEFEGESVASERRAPGSGHKVAAPDRIHIPIIQINAASAAVIDEIIAALARGEIFIPEVSILPETIGVNNRSPPDLQVRFDCDVNDDLPPEEWTNWCLEFLHNQLYEYFAPMGAQWSRRPFQITLARKVRWMTPKHMNKYFARSEHVIDLWREKGPQTLQPPHADDASRGVILEEITKPHGIYLLQDGVPTNYFAPNFPPPYTTKMRRSMIRTVVHKSWDAKHRDWLSEPLPKPRAVQLINAVVMGCANPTGHLSPVEERGAETEIGVFGFDPVHDEPETPGMEEAWKRKVEKEKEARQREQEKSQRHREEGRPKHHLDTRPTASTMDETETDSPATDKQWTADFDADRKFFDGGSQAQSRTSSFGSSSKEVSFSDSSVTESEREQHRLPRPKERKRGDRSHERPLLRDPKGTKPMRRDMRDRRQDESEERGTPTSKASSSRQPKTSPISPSNDSMAYSINSSSQFCPPMAANNNVVGDGGSVQTRGTEDQSLLSYVTRSTVAQSRCKDGGRESSAEDAPEGDDISLSLLESESSIVPSDEELRAIGWAKALDPSSGAHYYFTLDRTQTVWENPLATSP